jgi:ATP-dependent NAD(P)H-hydrate dehydratase
MRYSSAISMLGRTIFRIQSKSIDLKISAQSKLLFPQASLSTPSPYFYKPAASPINCEAANSRKKHSKTMATMATNADLVDQVKSLIPPLDQSKYKGQAGKVAVIGGCREYTGAPFFAAYSALKVGADLSHVFCTSDAAAVIKTYSPELIVHPYLLETPPEVLKSSPDYILNLSSMRQRAVDAVSPWLQRFDVLVVGPGLGRDPLILETVTKLLEIAKLRELPLVIDADGLWLINKNPSLIEGYSNAVLTPNAAEFNRLCTTSGIDENGPDALKQVTLALNGPIIVQKGSSDVISNGLVNLICNEQGSLRRAGGQGDVLSGTIATYIAWCSTRVSSNATKQQHYTTSDGQIISPLMLAAFGGCLTTRIASRHAFEKQGRAMGASDVIAELGRTIDRDLNGALNSSN